MEWVDVVSTLGFPVAMVLLEAWYIKYQHDQNHEETEKFTKALEENTLALTELRDKLLD